VSVTVSPSEFVSVRSSGDPIISIKCFFNQKKLIYNKKYDNKNPVQSTNIDAAISGETRHYSCRPPPINVFFIQQIQLRAIFILLPKMNIVLETDNVVKT